MKRKRFKSGSRLAFRFIPLGFATVTLIFVMGACSKKSGSDPLSPEHSENPTSNSSPAPTPPPLDVNAEEVSTDGCLDLEKIQFRMAGFPKGTVIREYTQTFEMANVAIDKKPLIRLRNMSAESAFSSFRFDERESSAFLRPLPEIQQDGCRSLTMVDELKGRKNFNILSGSNTNTLLIQEVGGDRALTYKLTSPREIEITDNNTRIDRCPDFQRAMSKTVSVRTWGTTAEVEASPAKISLNYLKQISVAVVKMPVSLSELMSMASNETIEPSVADLKSMRDVKLDPQIAHCPYHASPPSADEAPPPEETDTLPSSSSSPSPAPTATPAS